MLVDSIKLLDVEFIVRTNEVVSPLMSVEEADNLLARLKTAELAKALDSCEPICEPKAFVAPSRTENDKFRVVLHLPALITPLLNTYYPVINDNKNSVNPKWLNSSSAPLLSLPPTTYIYKDLWIEHPIIEHYFHQLISNFKVNFIRSSHKREDRILLKGTEQFYHGIVHLHALLQPIRQLISDLRARYIVATAPRDKIQTRQLTDLLNQDLAAVQHELNQHLIRAHSLYPLADTSTIENALNELLIDLYCQYGMPLEGWKCFELLSNSELQANQQRLEQLIMAYYAHYNNVLAVRPLFLDTLSTMYSYQNFNSSVTNLLARALYPLVHSTVALDQSLTLISLWQISSMEQLNECSASGYSKQVLVMIELLFFKDVQQHATEDYIKAIDLLIEIPSPHNTRLLIKCLNDFFISTKAMDKPETWASNSPGYVTSWEHLYKSLQKKENPIAGPKLSSVLSLLFTQKSTISVANDSELEVLKRYQFKANPYRQKNNAQIEYQSPSP